MSLNVYKRRRDFSATPEPDGEQTVVLDHKIFVLQRHNSSILHYDLRIEVDGVLKSWAIPKGPSMNPDDRRLAICMEDHPLSYAFFKGTIPEGNYGAGNVEILDRGECIPYISNATYSDRQILKQIKSGNLKFTLKGKFFKGVFSLVRIPGGNKNLWILIKGNDKFSIDYSFNIENLYRQKFSRAFRKESHPA